MLYDIIYHFIIERLIGVENALGLILVDASLILIYIALVYMLIWVFKIASRIIRL